MVSFDQVILIVPILALAASITYYAMVLRNQNKTRQTQMFMQLYNTRYEEKNAERFWRIMKLEWDDFDDYVKKHSILADQQEDVVTTVSSEFAYYDGLGILLKQNMVDRDTMYELMGQRIIMFWFKVETIIKGFREAEGVMSAGQDYGKNFEYLANEMIRMKKERGVKLPVYWLHPTSTLLKELSNP